MKTEVEFTEVYSKSKSKTYMIGDLTSYLTEQINSGDYNMTSKGEYLVECPYCRDAYLIDSTYSGEYLKRKLYIHPSKQFGNCFRCNRVFLSETEGEDAEESIKMNLPKFGTQSYGSFKPSKLSGEHWNLDLFYELPEESESGLNYLIGRHIYMSKLYKILKFRFLANNPVIPFFYKGEFIYYQVRYANHAHGKLPYFSPPIDNKPAYVIEHGDNKKIMVCEGVFDAIGCMIMYPEYTPFALLGCSITDYQLSMLRSYVPTDISVFCDETSLSRKVLDKILTKIDYANVNIIESDGEDPEERMKRIYKL